MTFADRTAAIPSHSDSPSARHAFSSYGDAALGVCLGRHNVHLPRIEYGVVVANLFKALESRGFATPQTRARTVGRASFTFTTNLSTPRSESPRIVTVPPTPWLELWSVSCSPAAR